MWEQFGQILAGVAAIITAVGGLWVARSRQIQADLAACQAEQAEQAAREQALRITAMVRYTTAITHISYLEDRIYQLGGWVPVRPAELRW